MADFIVEGHKYYLELSNLKNVLMSLFLIVVAISKQIIPRLETYIEFFTTIALP